MKEYGMDEVKPLISIVSTDNDIQVVKLLPRQILDELQISEIGGKLKDLIDSGANKIVLDFSGVDHFSSSALGMLITTQKHLSDNNGIIKLCYIRSQILKVFKITRLDEIFSIYKTATEALASFSE
jgi:anti-sigma B factor antagonist